MHEITLDGFRMAARVDQGRVQLLTRTGLDWTDKYPSAVMALADVKMKTASIDPPKFKHDRQGVDTPAHQDASSP